jgi:hypothetical protein
MFLSTKFLVQPLILWLFYEAWSTVGPTCVSLCVGGMGSGGLTRTTHGGDDPAKA